MKKIIALAIALSVTGWLYACNLCGCALASNQAGLLYLEPKNTIGLLGNYRYSTTHHPASIINETQSFESGDHFSEESLFIRLKLSKNLHLLAFVPYRINSFSSPYGNENKQGLGDISANLYYNIKLSSKKLKSYLIPSLGLKFPTGKYYNGGSDYPILYPGTSSLDIQTGMSLLLRRNKFGSLLEGTYLIKNNGFNNYKYGNQAHVEITFLGWFKHNNQYFIPSVGFGWDKLQDDVYRNKSLSNQGYMIAITPSIAYDFQKIQIGFKVKQPIYQHFASNDVKNKQSFSLNINYNF